MNIRDQVDADRRRRSQRVRRRKLPRASRGYEVEPAFYTTEAAAQLLSTTPEEIDRLVAAGELRRVHLTGTLQRITADSLARYREAHRSA